jgi:hypothetical protein
MRLWKYLYWDSTLALCLIYVAGAAMNLAQRPMVEEGLAAFGFPACLARS